MQVENEKTLSSRKAQLLIEENKSLQTDLRVKEREIQTLKMQAELNDKQEQLKERTLER